MPHSGVGIHAIPPPEASFHLIGTDHIVPFSRSSAYNHYNLVVVYHLTKWVETCAVPSMSAEHVIHFRRSQILLVIEEEG